MPRIRSLKPECMQHRKVGRLSHLAFRLWIGMLTQADDEGRLVAELEQLRVLFFGYHPKVFTRHVKAARDELMNCCLITVYRVEEVDYAYFPSWRDHQRINRPTPSKLPSPFPSMNPHGAITEDSLRTHAGSEGIGKDQGSDRKGKEGSGEENPDRSLSRSQKQKQSQKILEAVFAGQITREQGNAELHALGLAGT